MNVKILTSPLDIVQHWPEMRKGFEWLSENTKFEYDQDNTFRTLCCLLSDGTKEKSFIAVAYKETEMLGFLVAFDATPVFEENRLFSIYALWHRPSQIRTTRKLLNNFELWAVSQGVTQYSLATRKYGKTNLSLFSRLGFKRDSLILTKEI